MPRRYPPEFRRKVLDLSKSGRTVAEVAAGLDVTEQTIYNWRNQELIDTGQKPGLSSIESAELAAARRRIAELETELAIAKRSTELLKSVVLPKAVRSDRSDGQRRTTGTDFVSESGFYEWRNRPPSQRSLRHAWLTQLITEVHTASHGTYGARRIHAELTLGHDIAVGHGCIEMLMRAAGVKGLPGNKRARSKHRTPTVSDLVDRKFTRDEPNKLWVTDITEHPTRVGKIYCAVVLDTFSRRVVGWSIDSSQTATLVTNALGMAISNRGPTPGTLIHSDHGVQFTSWTFTRRAHDSGLVPSMGSIGDCYDNAVIESFWGRMQTELLNRKRWKTRVELANAMFEYLEIFHNRQRRHSALGMLTPIEFENVHFTRQPVA